MRDLHAGEALHVELREALVQRLHDAEVILERPGRMEPRDDVKPRRVRVAHGVLDDRDGLCLRHRIGALLICIAAKGAELAVRGADIRQVDMAVDVIVDNVPALFAAHVIGQGAEPGEVMALEEPYAVLPRQALSAHHLRLDILIFSCSQQNKNLRILCRSPQHVSARIACKLLLLYHRTFQIPRSKVMPEGTNHKCHEYVHLAQTTMDFLSVTLYNIRVYSSCTRVYRFTEKRWDSS